MNSVLVIVDTVKEIDHYKKINRSFVPMLKRDVRGLLEGEFSRIKFTTAKMILESDAICGEQFNVIINLSSADIDKLRTALVSVVVIS
jgi:hypothetical protein